MELLKPIFCAISLIGIHIGRPFHYLIMDKKTTYSTLCIAYPRLHNELITLDPVDLLQPGIQILKFVSEEAFKNSLSQKDLMESLVLSVNQHKKEVVCLVKILINKIAEGLNHQKGAIFSFGKPKDEETGKNVVKFANVSDEVMSALDRHVTVHNIGEERNVGMVNYELSIRGKGNLSSVSKRVVINKSSDLLSSDPFGKYVYKGCKKTLMVSNWNGLKR